MDFDEVPHDKGKIDLQSKWAYTSFCVVDTKNTQFTLKIAEYFPFAYYFLRSMTNHCDTWKLAKSIDENALA